jgi:drug/metabolite transporter (DMT)-like permease
LLPFFLISWAEQFVDSSVAGLLNGTGPLVTVLGAHFITRDELLTKGRLAGILVGLGGVAILLYDGLAQLGGQSLFAQLALILAFSCYAGGNLMVRGVRGITPVQLTGFSLALSSVLALPLAYLLEQPEPARWSADVWLALLWLGLVSTAFAFSLRYVLIRRAGAGFMSNVGYTIPIVAVVIGVVLLGEAVTIPKLAAFLVILASLYITRHVGVKLRD